MNRKIIKMHWEEFERINWVHYKYNPNEELSELFSFNDSDIRNLMNIAEILSC